MKPQTLPDYFMVSECSGELHDTRTPGWHTHAPLRAEYARTFSTIATGRQFRATLRAGPFAWPGGYPLALQCSDGESLCFDCGRSEAHQIIRSIRDKARDGWRVIGCFVHWEGAPIDCAHCGKGIPSAYGCDDDEVGCTRRRGSGRPGRPSYRWARGWEVRDPDTCRYSTPMRYRDALAHAHDMLQRMEACSP